MDIVKSNRFFILLSMLIVAAFAFAAPATMQPVNLQCELRKEPLGIDVMNPTFSYTLLAADDKSRGLRQTAYQILVASSPELLQKNNGDLWNSDQVKSDRMAFIRYEGKPLLSNQKCYWKIRVWDQDNNVCAYSNMASWTMGIIDKKDWQAKWISAAGADKYALPSVGYLSQSTDNKNDVKWLQVDLGTSQPFSKIELYPTFYKDRASYAFPLKMIVTTSDDQAFKTSDTIADLSSHPIQQPGYKPFTIAAANAKGRYVRITVTQLPKVNDRFAYSLRQVEIWSAGKNIAAGKPVTASDGDETDGFKTSNLTDRVPDYSTFPNFSSLMLRKEFAVKPKLVRAVINITGLSEYELTINGKKIGNYLFTPGWTDYRKTVLYDTYDVTQQLASGNNAIGILLGNGMYNIQPDTERYVKFITTFGPVKAKAQLRLEYSDGSVQQIMTDKTWQAAPGPITYSNLYGGEDYDANLEPNGWNKAGFSGSQWTAAIETDGPGGELKGLSYAAPSITMIDTIKPVSVKKISDSLWIYDFGQNASMMPDIAASGTKGASVRMIPSELLGTDGLADRTSATQSGVRPAWWQYTLSGSGTEQWFPKFFYQGARYLQVELRAGADGRLPVISQLKDVIVHSSSQPVGTFETSNTLFNKIYSLVRWAQRSNMMSLMTDCPHREKMGWLEENQLNGPALRYNFDMSLLCRKLMSDIADTQLDNGFVPNIAPEYFIAGSPDLSNGMRNSPEWGSSFIIVPWQQYLFAGDISLLERYYDRMKRYVGFLTAEAKNDIVYTGLGDWYDIGPREPWGSQLTPEAFTATAIYFYDNEIMYKVAKLLHKNEDAAFFKTAAERIRKAFNEKFYHPETGLYATASQTTCAMPLFFNLVEPQNRDKLTKALVDSIRARDNGFTSGEVGYRFLLRALAEGGHSDVVFDMNNQSEKPGYGYQIRMGATSLTEKWDAGVGNFGSQNHFMSGQINEWFFHDLVGIDPDEAGPGFRQFIIKPAILKGMSWVKGSYHSISGDIVCNWKKEANQVTMKITVPPNTTAIIYIPANSVKEIKESGKAVSGNKQFEFVQQQDGYVVYKVGSGNYTFSSIAGN